MCFNPAAVRFKQNRLPEEPYGKNLFQSCRSPIQTYMQMLLKIRCFHCFNPAAVRFKLHSKKGQFQTTLVSILPQSDSNCYGTKYTSNIILFQSCRSPIQTLILMRNNMEVQKFQSCRSPIQTATICIVYFFIWGFNPAAVRFKPSRCSKNRARREGFQSCRSPIQTSERKLAILNITTFQSCRSPIQTYPVRSFHGVRKHVSILPQSDSNGKCSGISSNAHYGFNPAAVRFKPIYIAQKNNPL